MKIICQKILSLVKMLGGMCSFGSGGMLNNGGPTFRLLQDLPQKFEVDRGVL